MRSPEEVQGFVGREIVYEAPEPLGRASIRYFARAVGDDNPVYTDPEAAHSVGFADVVAPPTFVVETNQYVDRSPDAEGYIGHSWDLGLGDVRAVRGGHQYRFHRPVHPTDRLRVTWRIEQVEEKSSSSGNPMLIVTSLATYEDAASGDLLAENRETIIYQERS